MILKKLLGEILTGMGFVTRQQLNEALQRQREILKEKTLPERLQRAQLVSEARLATDRTPLLGRILIDMGFATTQQLEEGLEEQERMADVYKSLDSEKLGIAVEMGFIVNSTLNIAEVLALIMRHANRVTNSVASTLMLLDDKTGELVFSVPTGPKADNLTDIRLPPGKGIAGWVAEHEQPVLVPNAREDPRFYPEIDIMSGFETKSILCVPLKAKAKLIGVLEVINKTDGTSFTEEDALSLSIFASQAGMAIENARLHGELKDRLEEEIQMQKRLAENTTEKVRAKEELRREYRDRLEELVGERTAELIHANGQLKREIAERGRAEKELQESEDHYRTLVETMNDGLVMMDGNMLLTFVNERFCQMLGYTRQELIGRPGTDLHDEANQRTLKEQMARQRQGEHEAYEITFTRKHGQQVFAIISPRPILDEEGHFKGSFAVVTDITKRKRAEEELRKHRDHLEELVGERTAELTRKNEQLFHEIEERKRVEETLHESEQKYKTLTASSLTGVFIHQDGKFVFVNDRFGILHGYKHGELLGKEHLTLVHPDDREIVKQRASQRLKGEAVPERYEIRRVKKDGKTIWCEMMATRIQYRGRPAIMGNIIDITDRKNAEEALRSSREHLRNLADHLQSVRETERTSIAHEIHDELAQALTALKMDISWLSKKLPEDQKTLLEKTKAMTKLTDMTIKTVKKISTELRPGLLDDLGLVAAIEWQTEDFQKRTGIICKLTVDPEDIVVEDKRSTALFRIFQETLTNIARHAKATRVTISLKEKDDKVALRVKDNGKGITKEQISDSKSFGLMGIRERVHPWGGKVKITGKPGEGTTVVVSIPIETG